MRRKTINTDHTAFTVKIRVHLFLECRVVHVSRTNANAERNGLLLSLTCYVLEDCDAGIDATALLEQCSDGTTRALGRDKDDINIFRRNNFGVLLVYDRETMREIERLALGDQRSNFGPCLRLRSVRKEVHDYGPLVDSLLDGEKGLSRHLIK